MKRLALLVLVAAAGCAPCARTFQVPDPGLERMIEQPRADALEGTTFFENGTLVRIPAAGTVPFEPEEPPPPLTLDVLDEGQRLYEITCAACHGVAGDGETVVAEYMRFVNPRDLHEEALRQKPARHFYEIATQGYGLMPSYRGHLHEGERWAVAYYVKALQLSRYAPIHELPPEVREALR